MGGARRKQPKVVGAIVHAVFVYVMDNLRARQRSADPFGHNKTVFWHVTTTVRHGMPGTKSENVSVPRELATALPAWVVATEQPRSSQIRNAQLGTCLRGVMASSSHGILLG